MELINRVVDECKPRVMYRTDECDVTEDELDKEMRFEKIRMLKKMYVNVTVEDHKIAANEKAEGSPEVNSPCSFDNKVVPGVEGGGDPQTP